MILYIASAIIFIFVSLNLFFRTACPVWIKIAGSLLILLVSLKYVVYQYIGGAFFSPHLPETFILVYEALYGALLLLFFLLIIWDIYSSLNWMIGKTGMYAPHKIPKGAIKSCLVFLALSLGIWGTWQAVKVPDARTVDAHIPGLPKALENFRLVQLTDLHIGPILKGDWLSGVVAKVNALEPDAVVMTGDYIDGVVGDIGGELKALADLKAKYGVFGVTGNHEYYWNAREWVEALEKLNVKMLSNENARIEIGGEGLAIVGIPDEGAGRFGFPPPDIKAAIEGLENEIIILLAHQPKNAAAYLPNVDLQLSGHTHGGVMFFLRPLIARFNSGFVAGEYLVNGKPLYVSPGTGIWNGMSARIGNPAEITLIILHGGEKPE